MLYHLATETTHDRQHVQIQSVLGIERDASPTTTSVDSISHIPSCLMSTWSPPRTNCPIKRMKRSRNLHHHHHHLHSPKLRTTSCSSSGRFLPLNLDSLIVSYAHWLLCGNESMILSSEKLSNWFMLKVTPVLILFIFINIEQIPYRQCNQGISAFMASFTRRTVDGSRLCR